MGGSQSKQLSFFVIRTGLILFHDFDFLWLNSLLGPRPPQAKVSLIIIRHTRVRTMPLNEISACRRDLYLTTHNTHNRQASTPWQNLNPQIQQVSGHRALPETARPLELACDLICLYANNKYRSINYILPQVYITIHMMACEFLINSDPCFRV